MLRRQIMMTACSVRDRLSAPVGIHSADLCAVRARTLLSAVSECKNHRLSPSQAIRARNVLLVSQPANLKPNPPFLFRVCERTVPDGTL